VTPPAPAKGCRKHGVDSWAANSFLNGIGAQDRRPRPFLDGIRNAAAGYCTGCGNRAGDIAFFPCSGGQQLSCCSQLLGSIWPFRMADPDGRLPSLARPLVRVLGAGQKSAGPTLKTNRGRPALAPGGPWSLSAKQRSAFEGSSPTRHARRPSPDRNRRTDPRWRRQSPLRRRRRAPA
jgi:hypothetical protein